MKKVRITPWLNQRDLKKWIGEAKTRNEHERRLAIWLTELNYTLSEVSSILAVSPQTLRRWINSYNKNGPEGLALGRWGGRRRGLLTPEQENLLLTQWPRSQPLSAKTLQSRLQEIVGRPVSLKYAYDLIRRHRDECRTKHLDGEKNPSRDNSPS